MRSVDSPVTSNAMSKIDSSLVKGHDLIVGDIDVALLVVVFHLFAIKKSFRVPLRPVAVGDLDRTSVEVAYDRRSGILDAN